MVLALCSVLRGLIRGGQLFGYNHGQRQTCVTDFSGPRVSLWLQYSGIHWTWYRLTEGSARNKGEFGKEKYSDKRADHALKI